MPADVLETASTVRVVVVLEEETVDGWDWVEELEEAVEVVEAREVVDVVEVAVTGAS